jgi:hypothetical protein
LHEVHDVVKFVFFCLFLSGCKLGEMLRDIKSAVTLTPSKIWLEKVNFKASQDINDSSPVKINIVIVYKTELLTQLNKMDSKTYFQSVEQIKSDFPGEVDILEADIVPGQSITFPVKMSRTDSVGGFIFAHYTTQGIHRAVIGEDQVLNVILEKADFKIRKE